MKIINDKANIAKKIEIWNIIKIIKNKIKTEISVKIILIYKYTIEQIIRNVKSILCFYSKKLDIYLGSEC